MAGRESNFSSRRKVVTLSMGAAILSPMMASCARTTRFGSERRDAAMQAERNKKLMTEIYTRLAHGDSTMFIEHLADDAVFTMQGNSSWSGERRGKDNILRFFSEIVAERAPGERRIIPKRVLAYDDLVVIEAVGVMTSKYGTPYRNDYCLIFRLENEKIVEMKEYLDTAYLEATLGPLPNDPTRDSS